MCIFLENGNLISSSLTHIRLMTPENEIKWEVQGNFHHQMNLSDDKKRILTLDSKKIDTPQGPRLSDVAVIIDAENGKRLYEAGADSILAQAKLGSVEIPLSPEQSKRYMLEKEISHFNSIYEIPKINNRKVPFYIKEGNIIINGTISGIMILTPDLRKVLYQTTFPQSHFHRVHDVQVKANGNYIFFNNVNAIPGRKDHGRLLQSPEVEKYASTILEIEPKNLKTVFEYGANPRSFFFSLICGSVQEYGDLIVFSHYLSGTYIYSKKQKDIVATVPGTHTDEMRVTPSQQIKMQNLQSFLQIWK